jgi:hypothetical protein
LSEFIVEDSWTIFAHDTYHTAKYVFKRIMRTKLHEMGIELTIQTLITMHCETARCIKPTPIKHTETKLLKSLPNSLVNVYPQ